MKEHVTWLPKMSSSVDMISPQVSMAVAQAGQIAIDVFSDFDDKAFEMFSNPKNSACQIHGSSRHRALALSLPQSLQLLPPRMPPPKRPRIVYRKQVKKQFRKVFVSKKETKRILEEVVSLISWEGKL